MLDTTAITAQTVQNTPVRKSLSYEKNDRMAGTIPVWKPSKATAQDAAALNRINPAAGGHNHNLPQNTAPSPEEFGFGDLLDMINPLHHIPIVGSIYREVTGDTIQPASRIMGGVVFGGPLGGGGALVNVIVEHETGTDLAGNLVNAVSGKPVTLASTNKTAGTEPLSKAIAETGKSPLPDHVLSFVDLGHGQRRVIERRYNHDDDDRMAGSQIYIRNEVTKHTPEQREPITQVMFEHNWE